MMKKYQGSKQIVAAEGQNKQKIKGNISKNNVKQNETKTKRDEKPSTSLNIDCAQNKMNQNEQSQQKAFQDNRQTPKSDRKPEINITYHKIRQQSKTQNPFEENEDENLLKQNYQDFIQASPTKDQQHYFTASFKDETAATTKPTQLQTSGDTGTGRGMSSCLMLDCSGQKKAYQSNYNLYNDNSDLEHVCDEYCIHDDEEEEEGCVNSCQLNKSDQKINNFKNRQANQNQSPGTDRNMEGQNELQNKTSDRSQTPSRMQINSLNAKLAGKNQIGSSSTPNKNLQIININQNNTLQSTKQNLIMGFHTTSSKQLNISNTVSSVYVNPFNQNYSSLEENEKDFNTLTYGSINQPNQNHILFNANSQPQQSQHMNTLNILESSSKSPLNNSFVSNIGAAVGNKYINTQQIQNSGHNLVIRNNQQSKSPRKYSPKQNSHSQPKVKGVISDSSYQEKIEKIQKLQQRVINKSRRDNDLLKNIPNTEQTKLQQRHQDQEENLQNEREEDFTESDPVRQMENEFKNQASSGNYYSKLEDYQNASHIKSQQNDNQLFLNTDNYLKEHLGNSTLRSPQRNTFVMGQSQHSLYSTQSGFFNKQQDDMYLGSLNNFVDAKIQTLHVLIQQKRKLQLMIEEKQMNLKTLKQDKQNQQKQEEIYEKEIQLCLHRQQNLLDQNKDLELQLTIIGEKIIEKSQEYQTQFTDLQNSLSETMRQYAESEKIASQEQLEISQIKQDRIIEQEYLKDRIKEADDTQKNIREKTNHKNNEEKNRVQFMRTKGNDVLKVIQDDKVFSERQGLQYQQLQQFSARDKSQTFSRNNHQSTNQNINHYKTQTINVTNQDISQGSVIVKQERSTSPINGVQRGQKQNEISQQLQSYMQKKISKHKNQNISCISINQPEDHNYSKEQHINFSITRSEYQKENRQTTVDKQRNHQGQNLIERDKNLRNETFRKDSDQVLTSSKSSHDLNRHQVQGGKADEEKKHQYFDINQKRHNFDINAPTEKHLQQSKSAVRIGTHYSESQQSKVQEAKINLNVKGNKQQINNYQSSQAGNIKQQNKFNNDKNVQATYATVNLF